MSLFRPLPIAQATSTAHAEEKAASTEVLHYHSPQRAAD
jgi:hypothetical protein